MRKLLVFLLLIGVVQAQDKVFAVPEYGEPTKFPELVLKEKTNKENRPNTFYYLGIIHGDLNYDLPTLNGGTTDLTAANVGVNFAKKIYNDTLFADGYFEISAEWQRFKRETGINLQHVNIYMLNFIQNFDVVKIRDIIFMSAGVGIAPTYLMAERSIFGEPTSRLGAMVILKTDFMLKTYNNWETVLGLKLGLGKLASEEIFLPSLHLGLNFE